jgi:large subunit ribosomal protein L14e
LTIEIPKSARLGTLRKAFTKAQVLQKWEQTSWAKKLALKKKKASLSDFERFKVMVSRKKVCFTSSSDVYLV